MADIKYTKMQQEAIRLRDKNILVSAAAGSGKTAVLVQRIIDRVLDENDPVDIDRILVMTFTRAAAQQMKEKIIKAIDDKKTENPGDTNVQRQFVLVHNASIMTIDSFCLSVVRNHFEEIDLSPDFRMADEGEVRLLMQDVLERLLEERYEEGDTKFLKMTETFSTGKSDKKLESIIFDLYEYSQSYPYPDKWLEMCGNEYSGINIDNFSEKPWVSDYVNHILASLRGIKSVIARLCDLCNEQYGPKQYEEAVNADMELIDMLLRADTYKSLYEAVTGLCDYKFTALSRANCYKDAELSEYELQIIASKKDKLKSARDSYKKTIQKLMDNILLLSPEEVVYGMNLMAEPVGELIGVTREFLSLLSEAKRLGNIVDFSDLEHFCLEILKKGIDTTALEYEQFYKEIYVDEYQDSNLCQEEILKYLTAHAEKGKLFMVGDNKQSIYGFRLARPQIFIDKYNRFTDAASASDEHDIRDIKIDLSDNFRSRIEVLNTVNGFFKHIMTKDIGGIEYNDRAALKLGAKYCESGVDNKSGLMLMCSDESISSVEAEAMMIASEIKRLMRDFKVSEDGNMRPLKYSDIVILMRSPKGRDGIFLNVLENEGIPTHITSSQGYFSAPEIVILLDYLKIIDNPLQDIPFAAVMLSVIGGFDEEELAYIRAAYRDGYLFDACVSYADTYTGQSPALCSKLEGFLSDIGYYRKKSEYSSVEEIVTEIVDTDYGNFVKAMPNGKKKIANLNMLITKAKEYGKTSFKGIFHFNRYIEALRKYDIDYGEANFLDENDDTVRIMSIHKSKGLEFPVCFLCLTGGRLNLKDAESSIIIDNDYGFATDVFDIDKRIKAKSLLRLAVSDKKKLEQLAEELRLLYVAMTRAKEKLIITGSVKSEDDFYSDAKSIADSRSYLDFIKYALSQYDDGAFGDFLDVKIHTVEDLVTDKTYLEAESIKLKEKLKFILAQCADNILPKTDDIAFAVSAADEKDARATKEPAYIDEIRARMSFVYPYDDGGGAVKMSVSELKHRSGSVTVNEELLSDENTMPFNTSSDDSGALHGSAVHRIFELWDYDLGDTDESVNDFLAYVKAEKLMEADLYDTLNTGEIAAFVRSDIAGRMKKAYKAGTLSREQPFVIALDENDPDSMLIQGIIDAYFIEDGEIVLVDYKTDKNRTERMLINAHKTQLDYYAMALERMLGLKVKDKIIYSTELNKSIRV